MLIFSKNHEISNFTKIWNICPKCMKSKYDGPEAMLFRFALAEHAYKPFEGRILMHLVTSWDVNRGKQNFEFQARAHFRARIMARAHDCHQMRNFIFYISSLYIKSIGPTVFDAEAFFPKKNQTSWRVWAPNWSNWRVRLLRVLSHQSFERGRRGSRADEP